MHRAKKVLFASPALVMCLSCTSSLPSVDSDASSADPLDGFWEATQATLSEFACVPGGSPLTGIATQFATPADSAAIRTFYEFATAGDDVSLRAIHVCDIASSVCFTTAQEADEANGLTLTQDFADGQLTILRTVSNSGQGASASPIAFGFSQSFIITQEGEDDGTIRLSNETTVSTTEEVPADALGLGSPAIAADESIACTQNSEFEMTRESDPTDLGFTLVNASGPDNVAPAIRDDDHILVEGDPLVTVIEYADFECPGCGIVARDMLPAIELDYVDTGRVRWIFRHYPLRSIHQNADIAAQASECADDQDLFWDYHDLLYANQAALTETDLKAYAAQLGMNQETFDACLASGEKASRVQFDLDSGLALSVTATPTFFINDEAFVGVPPLEEFTAALDQAIAAAGELAE